MIAFAERALEPLGGRAMLGERIAAFLARSEARVRREVSGLGKLAAYPNFAAWLTRMHARPAFKRSVEKGGAYRLAG